MRYVVIMAGGSGTRLWPLSRKGMPKQLLRLIGDKSLLRLAYERIRGMVPDSNILVCTGQKYQAKVLEELPELGADQVLGEPMGRDSLNAVAWPMAVIAKDDPDAVVAILSADQIIENIPVFQDCISTAYSVAQEDPAALVTLGVVPTGPNTGFGYLELGKSNAKFTGVFAVREFKEKPDIETARAYVESGEYLWNSGIFVWRAATLLDQLKALVPDCYELVTELAAQPERLDEIFPKLPKISIDYAVMEPVSQGRGSAHVMTVKMPVQWRDVGGFAALKDELSADESGNSVDGAVIMRDTSNSLIMNRGPEGSLVAVLGLDNIAVVTTGEVTMVCSVNEAQKIKELVGDVEAGWGEQFS